MTTMLRTDWTLTIDADRLLREQGADPEVLRARRPRAAAVAEQALAEGLPLLAPAAAWCEHPVCELRHQKLLLASGAAVSGPLVAQHLAGAERVLALVCTVGPALERRAAEVMADDPALALALDSLGSLAASLLSAAARVSVCERAADAGLRASMALSPGLEGWPVDVGQPQIFALFDADPAGVTLTPSCQMLPRKSTSALLGLGRRMAAQGHPCDYCGIRETCRHREH